MRSFLHAVVLFMVGCAAADDSDVAETATSATSGPMATGSVATSLVADSTSDGAEPFLCDEPLAALTDLFATSCATAGCHGAQDPAASLSLVGDWPTEVVAQPAALCPDRLLVSPGDPEASELWTKVAGDVSCGVPMPLGAESLTGEQVDCLATWIESAQADCETCGSKACVDTVNDPVNCGGCGVACPAGVACQASACACPAGTELCGDTCVDTTANGEHCGGCNLPCDGGLLCLAGACVDDCGALSECAGGCVNTDTDPQHCGGCDSPCAGGGACDAGSCDCGPDVSFAGQVEPLLTEGCTSMGCHGFPMPKEDLDLRAGTGHGDLVGVGAMQCDGRLRVAPGDPGSSYLVDKLLGVNLCSGSRMPKDPPPFDPADIELISNWICQGAPNN